MNCLSYSIVVLTTKMLSIDVLPGGALWSSLRTWSNYMSVIQDDNLSSTDGRLTQLYPFDWQVSQVFGLSYRNGRLNGYSVDRPVTWKKMLKFPTFNLNVLLIHSPEDIQTPKWVSFFLTGTYSRCKTTE